MTQTEPCAVCPLRDEVLIEGELPARVLERREDGLVRVRTATGERVTLPEVAIHPAGVRNGAEGRG